ncbi:hypothetical protein BV898_01390 [Hypsibius exemplaris]|uniref:G-protein coupled receptors family 1 profile domain-containing protein n=1 Tax=Hypsibius exemplaris TaxID=2072580 RepID=A0A1W0XBN0_HYPEX|nr:hypothetical protein BV898_01390 [Hypsibius exemplaris]
MNETYLTHNLTELQTSLRNDTWTNRTAAGVDSCFVKPRLADKVSICAVGTVISVTQLFNLIIFALWRGKEPYINLHVGLALASLLAGLNILAAVPLILFVEPTNAHAVLLHKVFGFCLGMYTNAAAMMANFAISVDRWLSVEFAVEYRATVTKRKTLFIATVGVFGVAFLLATTGDTIFWEDITVDRCTLLVKLVSSGFASEFTMFWVFNGQFCLPLLFLTQLRILMISATYRLRRLHHRRQVALAHRNNMGSHGCIRNVVRADRPASRMGVVLVVWSSLWASMTVICGALIARLPYIILLYLPPAVKRFVSTEMWLAAGITTLVTHFTSPVVYLLLWPDYRKTLFRLCLRLRSVVTPHASIG